MKYLTMATVSLMTMFVLIGCQSSMERGVRKEEIKTAPVTVNIKDVSTDSSEYYDCFNDNIDKRFRICYDCIIIV